MTPNTTDTTMWTVGDVAGYEAEGLMAGETYPRRAEVVAVTGEGGPGDVLTLKHPGDNGYRVGDDGSLLNRTGRVTAWKKMEEER